MKQVQRWPWERIGRGYLLLRCISSAAREVWGAHGDERGGGISCRHAHSLLCWVTSYISLQYARMAAARYEFIVYYLSVVTICWIYSGTELSACFYNREWGNSYWTAGQRIDPSRNSSFIWRVKSTDTNSETVSQMSYTNWNPGEPNYKSQSQSCMKLWSQFNYTWDDDVCSRACCSLCELDI